MPHIPRPAAPFPSPEFEATVREQRIAAVRESLVELQRLTELHGRTKAHVMLLSGLSSEEIDEVGGLGPEVKANDCQEWGDSGVEPQQICPVCGHYALSHIFDGCTRCKDSAADQSQP